MFQFAVEQKVIDRHLPICYGGIYTSTSPHSKYQHFVRRIIPGRYVPVECNRSCIGGALEHRHALIRSARYRLQHVAVVCGGQHLTFQAFNRRVNHLAQRSSKGKSRDGAGSSHASPYLPCLQATIWRCGRHPHHGRLAGVESVPRCGAWSAASVEQIQAGGAVQRRAETSSPT